MLKLAILAFLGAITYLLTKNEEDIKLPEPIPAIPPTIPSGLRLRTTQPLPAFKDRDML